MPNALESLKSLTTVVADTGDFETLAAYTPQDATTNPSLILKALQKSEYASVLDRAVADTADSGTSGEAGIDLVIDHLLVGFGQKILEIVPGRVSTEVDAALLRHRGDREQSPRTHRALYGAAGTPRSVLIKITRPGRASKRQGSSKKRASAATLTSSSLTRSSRRLLLRLRPAHPRPSSAVSSTGIKQTPVKTTPQRPIRAWLA